MQEEGTITKRYVEFWEALMEESRSATGIVEISCPRCPVVYCANGIHHTPPRHGS